MTGIPATGVAALRATALALFALCVLAIALAGCGSSSTRSTSSANVIPLTERVIDAAQFPGFHGIATPTVIRSPRAWEANGGFAGPQLRQASERLRRLGFVAGVREQLDGPAFRSAVEITSLVEQFRSAAAAHSQLAHARRQPRGDQVQPALPVRSFGVPQIPGALGLETTGTLGSSQALAFAAGPFYYQVVVIRPAGGGVGPTQKQLINASASLYRRVRTTNAS